MATKSLNLRRRGVIAGGATLLAAGGAAAAVNAASPFILPETPHFGINHSYWSLALPPPNPRPVNDFYADVIVIGGGYTGLSAAYYLRQTLPSAKIVVLEAVRCGNGASGRNGAMLQTSTEDTFMVPNVDPLLHRRLYALTINNIERIRNLADENGMDCEFDLNGSLQVAYNDSDAQKMPDIARKLRAAGLPIEVWNQEQIFRTLGTHAYPAALFDPGSGQVHPGKLVAMWKRAAEGAGVTIFEQTPVTAIDQGPIIRLHLSHGLTAKAPMIVLATNAYSSKLGYLRSDIVPIVNFVAITPPLTKEQLNLVGWTRRIPFNDSRVNVVYAGITRDNRVHIGGGIEEYEFNDGLFNPSDNGRGINFLRREMTRIYPALSKVPFERTWWGFVDMSIDGTSSVGRTGEHGNILYAIGLSGQGVNFTSVLGRVLADIAADREAHWEWLPYLNRKLPYIPNEPFRYLGTEIGIRLLSE